MIGRVGHAFFILLVGVIGTTAAAQSPSAGAALGDHPVILDADGKLASWVQPQERAYGEIVRLAWNQLLTGFPNEDNGLPTWLGYCCFDGRTLRGTAWPHNPASVFAGLAEGAARYYAYSGDRRVVDFMRRVLDHHLRNGTTPADAAWAWPSVPYASADHGAVRYRGAHDFLYAEANDPRPRLGRGDGYGVIEPDKVGELGLAYLTVWKLTGEDRYRDAAVACARALARHVRAGDATRSPWPFRVVAETGVVREEYCANLAFTLRLFENLDRLQIGDVAGWKRARDIAWQWAVAYPLKDDRWANYFEDLFWLPGPTNLNQYVAGEMARYLLEDPTRDPDWRSHAGRILTWVERTFGADTAREKGRQWGATTISEQVEYMYKMASHTARFASVLALWHERTGDAEALEKAFRSFNWASYMCDRRGVVRVGPAEGSLWFSDGYGDYIRHFMVGLGTVPTWAPSREDHVLRSSSVVTEVAYATQQVRYRTFDSEGEEVLRLSFTPSQIVTERGPLVSGTEGPGWSFDARSGVLKIRRRNAEQITVR